VEVFSGRHGETLSPSPVVDTSIGPVQGMSIDGLCVFQGIRYGAAPTGSRRFRTAEPPKASTRVQSAVGFGAPAIQGLDPELLAPSSDFAMAQQIPDAPFVSAKLENEDCLHLNVWTPGVDGARPVLVWLHGGGFAYGAASDAIYDGANIARRGDIVVVSLNHRLNLFGFMDLTEFDASFADHTNVGIRDIILALEWVKENIAAFGGDPSSVTIAGQSGGAGKVSHLLGSPMARGLFHRAIIQSGPGLRGIERDVARANTRTILDAAGIEWGDMRALETVPAQELRDRAVAAFKAAAGGRQVRYRTIQQMGVDLAAALRTYLDDAVLPEHPFDPVASPHAQDVPLLTGWVKDEWTYMLSEADPGFVDASAEEVQAGVAQMYDGFGPEIYRLAQQHYPHYAPGHLASVVSGSDISYRAHVLADLKSHQPAPVYVYEVTWETPVGGGLLRTPHCLDLPFVLDNVEGLRSFVGPGDEPQRMADQMSEAWIAFVRTGSPQTSALPQWPAYDDERRPTMVFDLESRVIDDPLGDIHAVFRRESL